MNYTVYKLYCDGLLFTTFNLPTLKLTLILTLILTALKYCTNPTK